MRRYLGIGVAWLGATVLSVVIASAAVAGIRDRVVETPVAIGLPTTTATTLPAATDPPPSTSTVTTTSTAAPTTTSTSTTAAPATTETTVVTATTAAPPATTTTTTTAPPPTTTTQPVTYSTHDLVGGSVTLSFGNGEVRVVSAVPRPGFSYEAEHDGPVEVEVKFTSDGHKSKLEAKVENGELKVSTEEEADGDED